MYRLDYRRKPAAAKVNNLTVKPRTHWQNLLAMLLIVGNEQRYPYSCCHKTPWFVFGGGILNAFATIPGVF